jgi:hypothetical protein
MQALPFDQALIIQPHWLNEIYANGKQWEMRSTKTHKRGTFGFIEQGTGLITGQFDLVDSLEAISALEYSMHFDKHRIPLENTDLHQKYPYPWVIKNIVRFDKPIKYKHPRGAVIWVNL